MMCNAEAAKEEKRKRGKEKKRKRETSMRDKS